MALFLEFHFVNGTHRRDGSRTQWLPGLTARGLGPVDWDPGILISSWEEWERKRVKASDDWFSCFLRHKPSLSLGHYNS